MSSNYIGTSPDGGQYAVGGGGQGNPTPYTGPSYNPDGTIKRKTTQGGGLSTDVTPNAQTQTMPPTQSGGGAKQASSASTGGTAETGGGAYGLGGGGGYGTFQNGGQTTQTHANGTSTPPGAGYTGTNYNPDGSVKSTSTTQSAKQTTTQSATPQAAAPGSPGSSSTLASNTGITGGPDMNGLGALGYYNENSTANPDNSPISQSAGVMASNRIADGSSLANDPSLKAAMDAFKQYQLPMLQNQSELAGLGRSNATTNAIGLAQGQALAPLMESAFGRETGAIDRTNQATEAELQRRERGIQRASDANLATIPYLMQTGQNDYNNRLGAINAASQFGSTQRGVDQAQNDAAYNDFLRRQGLSEQATYGPFGQLIPSTFGSRSLTSKG